MTARLAGPFLLILLAALAGGPLPAAAAPEEDEAAAEPRPELTRATICSLIDAAADRHALPVEFFTRLIWK